MSGSTKQTNPLPLPPPPPLTPLVLVGTWWSLWSSCYVTTITAGPPSTRPAHPPWDLATLQSFAMLVLCPSIQQKSNSCRKSKYWLLIVKIYWFSVFVSVREYSLCSSAKQSTPTTRKSKSPLSSIGWIENVSLSWLFVIIIIIIAWTSGFLSCVLSALTQPWSSTVCLSPLSRRLSSSSPSMKAQLAG